MHKWKPDDAWIGSPRHVSGPSLVGTADAAIVDGGATLVAIKTPECD
jgi:hypothetical protein